MAQSIHLVVGIKTASGKFFNCEKFNHQLSCNATSIRQKQVCFLLSNTNNTHKTPNSHHHKHFTNTLWNTDIRVGANRWWKVANKIMVKQTSLSTWVRRSKHQNRWTRSQRDMVFWILERSRGFQVFSWQVSQCWWEQS